MKQVSLVDLPVDVLYYLMNSLTSVKTYVNLRQTCRLLYDLTNPPLLPIKVCQRAIRCWGRLSEREKLLRKIVAIARHLLPGHLLHILGNFPQHDCLAISRSQGSHLFLVTYSSRYSLDTTCHVNAQCLLQMLSKCELETLECCLIYGYQYGYRYWQWDSVYNADKPFDWQRAVVKMCLREILKHHLCV